MGLRRTTRTSLILAAGCVVAIAWLPAGLAADSDSDIVARIDEHVRQGWADNEVEPSVRPDDYEFARRAALDIIGRIPSYDTLLEFVEDESPDKRQRYVDRLLDDPDYVRNWTNVWANILIGRAGNRGNRGTLERWLRGSFYRNQPYDKFVYDLVAAEGSGSENGAVAFLASHLNDQALPATAITARVFLGMQVQCTQCHNHPFNDWKQSQFWSMNAFFRGTGRMQGLPRGQTGLTDRPTTEVIFFEERSGLMRAAQRQFVDGTPVKIDNLAKPREQLARLITDAEKPYLAAAQVNRLWGHFFGFAFTRPADDMGPHNPPSHPGLLDYLAQQFREAGFDNKRLIRWITASEAYNLTSRYGEKNAVDDPSAGNVPLFSRVYLKNFTAEQLYDSLIVATEAHKANRGADEAEAQRQEWLRQFVRTFGTDENDESTTFNGTIPQALVMMNGALIGSALSGERGAFLYRVLEAPGGDIRAKSSAPRGKPLSRREQQQRAKANARATPARIETLFLVALQRKPSTAEMEAFNKIYQEAGRTDPIAGLQDVFWAILNSNEFIINH